MAIINFDFNAVYDCAERVRGMAEVVEQEGKKITSIITTVQSGWIGTGATAYINYLESVRVNIFERAQKLYSIADALKGSAIAAEEADREAARQLAAAEAAISGSAAAHTANQYNPPPPDTNNSPPSPDDVAKQAMDMLKNQFDVLKDAASKQKHKGGGRKF